MPSFLKCISLLSLSMTCVSALATPHIAQDHRRSVEIYGDQPIHAQHAPVVASHRLDKRCRVRGSSSSEASSTTFTPTPVVNVASVPSIASTDEYVEQEAIIVASASRSSAAPQSTKSTVKTSWTKSTAPTSTSVARPASTPTIETSTDEPSFMRGTQTGEGTYFATGLGACGITNSDDERIVAVSHLLFDSYPGYDGVNPNKNPLCGKKIKATYKGKSTTVSVVDRCEGCAITDLDFTTTAFDDIADRSLGRLEGVTWVWA